MAKEYNQRISSSTSIPLISSSIAAISIILMLFYIMVTRSYIVTLSPASKPYQPTVTITPSTPTPSIMVKPLKKFEDTKKFVH